MPQFARGGGEENAACQGAGSPIPFKPLAPMCLGEEAGSCVPRIFIAGRCPRNSKARRLRRWSHKAVQERPAPPGRPAASILRRLPYEQPGQPQAAMTIAQRIADNAPLAVKGLMKSARMGEIASREEAVAQMFEDLVPVMKSEDAAEGVQSFVERRAAVFKGR